MALKPQRAGHSWRALWRVFKIARTALRWRLQDITPAAVFFKPLSWIVSEAAEASQLSRGARLRRALEELGPLFVKSGQILSTRRDLLPMDIADELALLQDRVAPFPGAQAIACIEKALSAPISELYRSVESTPLASASIAQVHAAVMLDGRDAVVKVLRPGIQQRIQQDLDVLKLAARIADARLPDRERIRPVAFVAEIERALTEELDLLREGANGSLLRRNFLGSSTLKVPEMFFSHSKTNVLTMERVYGTPLNDLDTLRASGLNFEALARTCVQLFFTQVFRDNFFHADLHPGNLLIDTRDPQNPQVIALDFGIMGQLSTSDQRYLAENFSAMFSQDYRRIAELHIEAGWMPPHIRIDELEGAVRTICEPYFTRPLSEVSLAEVLMKLFELGHRYELIIQPQLLLLQKTLLAVEGLARTLWPKLDIWAVAKPVLVDIMAQRYGLKSAMKEMQTRLPSWIQNSPEMPRLLFDYLKQATSGVARLHMRSDDIRALVETSRAGQRQILFAICGLSASVLAALFYLFGAADLAHYAGVPWLSWGFSGVAALAFWRAWPRTRT
jgi:ubiquinone biosynthesis protein